MMMDHVKEAHRTHVWGRDVTGNKYILDRRRSCNSGSLIVSRKKLRCPTPSAIKYAVCKFRVCGVALMVSILLLPSLIALVDYWDDRYFCSDNFIFLRSATQPGSGMVFHSGSAGNEGDGGTAEGTRCGKLKNCENGKLLVLVKVSRCRESTML